MIVMDFAIENLLLIQVVVSAAIALVMVITSKNSDNNYLGSFVAAFILVSILIYLAVVVVAFIWVVVSLVLWVISLVF
jgi:hypothetical protein